MCIRDSCWDVMRPSLKANRVTECSVGYSVFGRAQDAAVCRYGAAPGSRRARSSKGPMVVVMAAAREAATRASKSAQSFSSRSLPRRQLQEPGTRCGKGVCTKGSWPEPSLSCMWTCGTGSPPERKRYLTCLLYTSDAADERSSVDLG